MVESARSEEGGGKGRRNRVNDRPAGQALSFTQRVGNHPPTSVFSLVCRRRVFPYPLDGSFTWHALGFHESLLLESHARSSRDCCLPMSNMSPHGEGDNRHEREGTSQEASLGSPHHGCYLPLESTFGATAVVGPKTLPGGDPSCGSPGSFILLPPPQPGH